ncbi:MAG TPA: hypothetical protein VE974_29550 [Thermoanaerobaculia bacterium]|nr:hypothetical protein [Thermoanaerobaculia bacterium]
MRRGLFLAATFLAALAAEGQRPIFEPDDFIDPAMLTGPLFISRLVAGGAWNPTDRFRPLADDAGLVVLTNSLYVKQFQFDYKHAEFIGVEESQTLRRCDCPDPVYFPTPPPAGATPRGPSGERSETLQLAFYRTATRRPITLRYRLAWTRREIDTTVLSPATGDVLEHHSGHDQSFTLDADTHFSLFGRDVWGTLYVARASSSGMPAGDRAQNEIAYIYRPPGFAAGPLLVRGKFTVGGITGRGAAGLNLVNPYLETIWRHERTKVTVRAIWSGEWTRSGIEGWQRNHQVALVLDRTLFVKIFDRPRPPSSPAAIRPSSTSPLL